MTARIALPPPDAFAAFCRKWRIVELALFGSALREDFRPDSDVDVLVRFAEDVRYGMFDFVHLQEELTALVGRPVDAVDWRAVERSENYLRREHILKHREVLYVAG
jgi:hypothetical protein